MRITPPEIDCEAYECHVRRNLKPFFGNTKVTRYTVNQDSAKRFDSAIVEENEDNLETISEREHQSAL